MSGEWRDGWMGRGGPTGMFRGYWGFLSHLAGAGKLLDHPAPAQGDGAALGAPWQVLGSE